EDRAGVEIGGKEIVRFPGVDGDNGSFIELEAAVANVDARGHTADVEDQMTLAMRVDVERAVQLVDRCPTEPAVEDGERPAHAIPSRCCLVLPLAFNNRGEIARAQNIRAPQIAPRLPQ